MSHSQLLGIAVLPLLVLLSVDSPAAGNRPVTPEPRMAFVANAQDGTVTAFSLESLNESFTLPVGNRAAHGIAASPDGRIVYVGDAEAQELVMVDAERQSIFARVPLSHEIHGIDISPDGRTVWVGGSADGDPMLGTLTAIDTASNSAVRVVSPGLGSASHFSFTPDGDEIWVASTSTNLIWIVDTATGRVAGTVAAAEDIFVPLEDGADEWGAFLAERRLIGFNEVATSADGKWAYAIGPASSVLHKIDVARRQVVGTAKIGIRGHGVTVSPRGDEVWVADWSDEVIVVDGDTLEIEARIPVPEVIGELARGANHIAFEASGVRAFVSAATSILVIDAESRRIERTIPVGIEPHEISLEDRVAPGAFIDSGAIIDVFERAGVAPNRGTVRAENTTDSVRLEQGATLESTERSVTVSVTPDGPLSEEGTVIFAVAMNTHSVDLAYDLMDVAVLRDSSGIEYSPSSWDGAIGGHHVLGSLRFDKANGETASGGYLQLELSGIGGAPARVFRWGL